MDVVPNDVAGLYKYIIGGLVTAVGALASACAVQWKQASDTNNARLKERDDLRDALNAANVAIANLVETAKQRNEVTQRIGELMMQVSNAMALLTDRLDFQHDRTNKDLEVALDAVVKLAASVRELTEDVGKLTGDLRVGVAELKAEIKTNG